jgi:hypothetical protein
VLALSLKCAAGAAALPALQISAAAAAETAAAIRVRLLQRRWQACPG